MTIVLRPEQEKVIREAISSGLAQSPEEALDQALDMLRGRVAGFAPEAESVAVVARRLATFGKRHGLSLGGGSVKELLHESRP